MKIAKLKGSTVNSPTVALSTLAAGAAYLDPSQLTTEFMVLGQGVPAVPGPTFSNIVDLTTGNVSTVDNSVQVIADPTGVFTPGV